MKSPCGLSLTAVALCFLLTASALPALATSDESQEQRVYINARFGYELVYPALLAPLGEADNSDGQRFVSQDGQVGLRVWGSHNVFGDSLRALFERERQAPDRTVTYGLIRDRFFVLSGFAGEDIFYLKTIHDTQTDTFATFLFTYPGQRKTEFDPAVSMLAASFRHLPLTR